MNKYTIYGLKSVLKFGQYKGQELIQIAQVNAKYIEWCLMNQDFFVISDFTAIEIKKIYYKFLDSEIAWQTMLKKYDDWKKIKEYEEELEEKLEKIRIENERYREENDDSNWDNEFYNDNLDIDQQSEEWWDSL